MSLIDTTIPVKDRWPWLFNPCHVRILMYMDGTGQFDGGSFDGLKHVIAALHASPWYWVRFEITKAHRHTDPTADLHAPAPTAANPDPVLKLTDLDLSHYDEIWLFGVERGPSYLDNGPGSEKEAITNFMNGGGGVLVTGDHEDLGSALSSDIPRAGKLRMWDIATAPPAFGPHRNITIRAGHPEVGTDSRDPLEPTTYDFDDQSDDIPQIIRPRMYRTGGGSWFHYYTAPHPILCSSEGVINVLPDHMHEGQIVIPTTLPAGEWPSSSGGVQIKPEAIAWANIVATSGDVGREFPVIGVYEGHSANVGRISADSTWHHFFDINLIGEDGNLGLDARGFAVSSSGQAALRKIDSYYRNLAIWLASPWLQRCMRTNLYWGAIWRDPLVMFDPNLPIYVIGAAAYDALGKYAPQCLIDQWTIIDIPLQVLSSINLILHHTGPDPGPERLHDFVLGASLLEMRKRFQTGPTFPQKLPSHEELDVCYTSAIPHALEAYLKYHETIAARAREVVELARAGIEPAPTDAPPTTKP